MSLPQDTSTFLQQYWYYIVTAIVAVVGLIYRWWSGRPRLTFEVDFAGAASSPKLLLTFKDVAFLRLRVRNRSNRPTTIESFSFTTWDRYTGHSHDNRIWVAEARQERREGRFLPFPIEIPGDTTRVFDMLFYLPLPMTYSRWKKFTLTVVTTHRTYSIKTPNKQFLIPNYEAERLEGLVDMWEAYRKREDYPPKL